MRTAITTVTTLANKSTTVGMRPARSGAFTDSNEFEQPVDNNNII